MSTSGPRPGLWEQWPRVKFKADESLLVTFTSDSELHDAMISIGAKPGNNLTQAVWEERKNKDSAAPKTRVTGTPVEVLVYWEGLAEPMPGME